MSVRGDSHIDFRWKCVIMALMGGGGVAINNDVLLFRKVIEF